MQLFITRMDLYNFSIKLLSHRHFYWYNVTALLIKVKDSIFCHDVNVFISQISVSFEGTEI